MAKKSKTDNPEDMSGHGEDEEAEAPDQQEQHDEDEEVVVPPPVSKHPPVLDLVVHRIRNMNHVPYSIVTLQSTPPHCSYSYLAAARENGSVELRSVNQKFRIVCTIAGQKERIINAMAWVMTKSSVSSFNSGDSETMTSSFDKATSDTGIPTLIGASQDGSIFVVNFQTLRLDSVTPSGGGGIFALESLYEHSSDGSSSSLVAAGCEDGSVRIFQLSSDDTLTLTLLSKVPTTGAAVVSLAWRRMNAAETAHNNNTGGNSSLAGTVLFAGVADGTIRMYSYQTGTKKSGRSLQGDSTGSWKTGHRMTVESMGRRIPTRVWSLKLLQDWTVVSADSLGNVQFWDGRTGSLEHSFTQTDQRCDVLDLVVASNECKVFASGVDSRVVCFERASLQEQESLLADPSNTNARSWILTHAQRPHSHDVKSLSVCVQEKPEHSGNRMEVLCTGGVDMKLCTYNVASFQTMRPRTIYPWPAHSPILVAKDAQKLAILKDTSVEVYQMGTHSGQVVEPIPVAEETDQFLLGTIEIHSQSNLRCGAFSDDGTIMVLCDSYNTFIFKLSFEKGSIVPVRISYETPPASAVSYVAFLSNTRLVFALSNAKMVFLDVQIAENDSALPDAVKKVQTISPQVDSPDRTRLLPPRAMASTSSGKWLAVLFNTHGNGAVDIYARNEDKGRDLYRHWWTLPSLNSSITAVSFLGNEDAPRLAVGCVQFELYIFDVSKGELDKWSRPTDGKSAADPMPTELSSRTDYPLRICTHSSCPDKVLMVRG